METEEQEARKKKKFRTPDMMNEDEFMAIYDIRKHEREKPMRMRRVAKLIEDLGLT